MRILITGGAGLVGSHAAEYFALKGDEVIILDNLARSKIFEYDKASVEHNWNYLSKYNNVKCIKGDVCSESDVKKALGNRVDVVIHTASQTGVRFSIRQPKEDFRINALGTLNILECTRQVNKDAILIYCSTNKVYGENIDRIPLVEKETRYIYDGVEAINEDIAIDLTGHTPYGVSKLSGDLYVQEYAHIYGMRTAVFRMSCIYGIRQFGFEDQGWLAWFIISAIKNRPITIYGNGKQVRDILYVTDLIKAFDKFIKSDSKQGLFNIGGGKDNTISLLEFLKEIKSLTGKEPQVKFDIWRPSDQKVYISDISKVKNTLGWSPLVNKREGIRLLFNWVKENINLFK